MPQTIQELLTKAAAALPPSKPSRSSWAPFAPVVRQLMTNGYNVLSAVDWLINEKEIKPAERAKAYRALLALINRQGVVK
jgi:hypothetical protein